MVLPPYYEAQMCDDEEIRMKTKKIFKDIFEVKREDFVHQAISKQQNEKFHVTIYEYET